MYILVIPVICLFIRWAYKLYQKYQRPASSKINLPQLYPTKITSKFALPFEFKLYLIQNASLNLKIKLSRTSKEMRKLLFRYNDHQIDILHVGNSDYYKKPKSGFWGREGTCFKLSGSNPTLQGQKPLKVSTWLLLNTVSPSQILNFSLDLTKLKRLTINNTKFTGLEYQCLLNPSLECIQEMGCTFENSDIIFEVMKSCPSITGLE